MTAGTRAAAKQASPRPTRRVAQVVGVPEDESSGRAARRPPRRRRPRRRPPEAPPRRRRPRRRAAKKAPARRRRRAKKAAAKKAPAATAENGPREGGGKAAAVEGDRGEGGGRGQEGTATAEPAPRQEGAGEEGRRPRRRRQEDGHQEGDSPAGVVTESVRLTIGDHGIADLSWQPGLTPDELQERRHGTGRGGAGVRCCGGSRSPSRRATAGPVARCCGRASGSRGPADRSYRWTTGRTTTWCSSPGWPSDVVGGPHGFSGVMNTVLPRKRLIAHVLMRDTEGRILLCDTAFKSDWELPGGIVEPGEAPRDGAIREVREELGIDLRGRPAAGGGLAAAVPGLGGRAGADLRRRAGDRGRPGRRSPCSRTRSCRWPLLTLDQAAAVVTPLSHRRLSVAVGQSAVETAYLEDGDGRRCRRQAGHR